MREVRQVARLGRSARLGAVLDGLAGQARDAGLGDGLGVGWYPAPEYGRPGTAPLRYRRPAAAWSDAGLAAVGAAVETGCLLAAVQGAPGEPADESACPPFLLGDVLLSCDGVPPGVAVALGRLVPSSALAAVGSTVPGAFVAALVAARLAAGDPLPAALRAAGQLLADRLPDAPVALLATDGRVLAGLAQGRPLALRAGDGAVLLASVALDGAPGWEPVPEGALVGATLDGVEVTGA